MTHNKDRYPIDYTAQNAREFNALKGVELIDARVSQDGELVATFSLSASDAAIAQQRLRKFVGALLPDGEEPESVQFDTLLPSDSNVVPLPELPRC